jgi:hypothetical protein
MSQSEFQEYRIIWQALPFNRRPKRVVFAKAKTELDAYALKCIDGFLPTQV